MYQRSFYQMGADDSAVLVVDIQERLIPAVENAPEIVERARLLLDAARLLDVPILVSEQYPKGLGNTVPEILDALPADTARFTKRSFSCCESETLMRHLDALDVHKVLVCGVEAHVCVLQTALDLLAAGYAVYAAGDAIGSRNATDYRFALKRLDAAGVVLTTAEAAVFEWCRGADHPRFKEISTLVKNR